MGYNIVQTLTAYKIRIGIWRSNQNVFKEELRAKQEKGEDIHANLNHLLELFVKNASFDSGKDTGYIIKFEDIGDILELSNGFKRTNVTPNSGRRDRDTVMYNLSSAKIQKHKYDSKWVAAHPRNIIFYEKDDEIYAAFHRIGGSGCKSVFRQVANELLNKEGLAIQMDLMISNSQETDIKFIPNSITLIKHEVVHQSSDITDQMNANSKKRKTISKRLTLSLRSGLNNVLTDAFRSLKLGLKSKEEVYTIIKENINDFDDYDILKLEVKLGNVTRVVDWNEIEKLIDGYDITDKMKKMSGDELTKLIKCTDDYMFNIVKIGE